MTRARRLEIAARVEEVFADASLRGLAPFLRSLDDADYRDPVLAEVLDMVEHVPQRGNGFGSLAPEAHDAYCATIRRLAGGIRADPTCAP